MQQHGKIGLLFPGKASSHSTALPSCCFSCVQCFRVSKIHRTLTWNTGSLTCVYTRGLGTQTTSQHNILTRKNSHIFLCCAADGVRTSGLCRSQSSRCSLYQLSHNASPGQITKTLHFKVIFSSPFNGS